MSWESPIFHPLIEEAPIDSVICHNLRDWLTANFLVNNEKDFKSFN